MFNFQGRGYNKGKGSLLTYSRKEQGSFQPFENIGWIEKGFSETGEWGRWRIVLFFIPGEGMRSRGDNTSKRREGE